MNNNKTTMDFLQMQHARHCGLLDDEMGDDFDLWLSELDDIEWVTIMSQYKESIIHDMKEKVSKIKFEGEAMEERYSIQHFKSEFSSAFSDPEFEDGLNQLIAHERQRALQEQREEMEQIVYGSMRTGGDVIVTTLLNGEIKKIVKAIKNLK